MSNYYFNGNIFIPTPKKNLIKPFSSNGISVVKDIYNIRYNNIRTTIRIYENGFTFLDNHVEYAIITKYNDPTSLGVDYYTYSKPGWNEKVSKIKLEKSGNGLWLLHLYDKNYILESLEELDNFNLE